MGVIKSNLRQLLRDRHLSLADLAEIARLPYATVCRMAGDGCNPTLECVLVVARTLRLEAEDIYEFEHARSKRSKREPNSVDRGSVC